MRPKRTFALSLKHDMIRRFSEKDKGDVYELMKSCGASKYQLHIFRCFAELFSESSFVKLSENNIVGFIGSIAPISKNSVHIFALFVQKNYKRCNVEKHLIEKVASYAGENNISNMTFTLPNDSNDDLYSYFIDFARHIKKPIYNNKYFHTTEDRSEMIFKISLEKNYKAHKQKKPVSAIQTRQS